MSDIAADIAWFRAQELELMDTTVTVRRPDGEPAFDPDTGEFSDPSTEVYSGVALVRSNMWQGSDTQLGQAEVRMRGVRAKFPADTILFNHDVITVDASQNDARLVGRKFTITDVWVDEWQISCTTVAEEVT